MFVIFPCSASGESSYDPLVVTQPVPLFFCESEERALLADINAVRLMYHLSAVVLDKHLDGMARAYAEDMAKRKFFGHVTPDGRSLVDRLAKIHYGWLVAEENIALDEDEFHANNALLHSPEHLKNILNAHVQVVGVAALQIGVGAVIYVEDFAQTE
jgi:uncharacterized protein YkwD